MNSDEKEMVNEAISDTVKGMIADLCKEYKKMLDSSKKIDNKTKNALVNSYALGIAQGINLANQLDIKVDVSLK